MVAKKLNLHLGGYTQVCRPAVRSFVRVVKRRVASRRIRMRIRSLPFAFRQLRIPHLKRKKYFKVQG